jgi:hypothetical protein
MMAERQNGEAGAGEQRIGNHVPVITNSSERVVAR